MKQPQKLRIWNIHRRYFFLITHSSSLLARKFWNTYWVTLFYKIFQNISRTKKRAKNYLRILKVYHLESRRKRNENNSYGRFWARWKFLPDFFSFPFYTGIPSFSIHFPFSGKGKGEKRNRKRERHFRFMKASGQWQRTTICWACLYWAAFHLHHVVFHRLKWRLTFIETFTVSAQDLSTGKQVTIINLINRYFSLVRPHFCFLKVNIMVHP